MNGRNIGRGQGHYDWRKHKRVGMREAHTQEWGIRPIMESVDIGHYDRQCECTSKQGQWDFKSGRTIGTGFVLFNDTWSLQGHLESCMTAGQYGDREWITTGSLRGHYRI